MPRHHPRDRLALEVVFGERRDDAEGDWLYWFELTLERDDPIAEDVPGADRRPIDHDHLDFNRRCKEPGHVDAEPALVLIPPPVADAIRAWLLKVSTGCA
ncbi:MAG: DUF6176 family protein [Acidimicrobiales bacterium]